MQKGVGKSICILGDTSIALDTDTDTALDIDNRRDILT